MSRGKRKPNQRQRRVVAIGIGAPVTATLEVERSGPDGDWEIVGVRRVDCDLSARGAMECMREDDLVELDRLAETAPDEVAS